MDNIPSSVVQSCSSISNRAWGNRNPYCFAIQRHCEHRRSRKINHDPRNSRAKQSNKPRQAGKQKGNPLRKPLFPLERRCHRIAIVTSVSPLSPSHVRRRVRSWLMTRHSPRVSRGQRGEKSAPMGRPTRKSIRERRYINPESVWIPPTGLRPAARTSPGQVRFLRKTRGVHARLARGRAFRASWKSERIVTFA